MLRSISILALLSLPLAAAAAPAAGGAAPAPTAAPAVDTGPVHSLVIHVPPGFATAGQPIALTAFLDAPLAETLVVRWREVGDPAWHDAEFERSSAGGWYAELPGGTSPGVEYYIAGRGPDGVEVAHFASAASPHVVRVEPTVDERLEDLDRKRLNGHRDRIAMEVDARDFGNRYGLRDRYLRAETSFTHLVGRELYELVFGFGLIQGSTPIASMPMGTTEKHGARYGFSGVRVRAAPGIFLDGRVSLGVSHNGFSPGVSGGVTFGRPWRSNVSVGGEFMEDLGPSVFVRLQWDTATPFLMAASVVRTDLPGVLIEQNGLFLKYELMYRAMARTTLRGSVSFGSRDGPAHFGAGLGAEVEF